MHSFIQGGTALKKAIVRDSSPKSPESNRDFNQLLCVPSESCNSSHMGTAALVCTYPVYHTNPFIYK